MKHKQFHKLLEEKGWSKGESESIEEALGNTNLFGQISLAALMTKSNGNQGKALNEPYPCIFSDSSDPSTKWNMFIDELEKQDIIDRTLPLNSDQRKEALKLLMKGKAVVDIKNSLIGILEVLHGVKSEGASKLISDLSGMHHTADLVTAMKTDLQLRIDGGSNRKHALDHTLKVINSGAIGSIVSDAVLVFIKEDNRTMRLAIIAYARMNGINITERNIDDLATALDKENPDFYPLLAGLVDTAKKEYGIQDVADKVKELKYRDEKCHASM